MVKGQMRKMSMQFLIIASIITVMALATTPAHAAADMTRPTILKVMPENNLMDVATHDAVTATFSESLDASTINTDTFLVTQRTTPLSGSNKTDYRSMRIEGKVTYDGFTATFTPKNTDPMSGINPLQPSNEYGNVFTATITSGVKDLAGNSLSRDYVWSFTTGTSPFNRGNTTSQSNQTSSPTNRSAAIAIPIQPPIQQPIVIPPDSGASGSEATTTNAFPWVLAIGGLLIVALIALIIIGTRNSTRQKSSKIVRPNPFGHVHPVKDIEGIGPEYEKRLQAMGIDNTEQLWKANPAKVATRIGAPLSSVKSWQQMAELASVKDIGPQYAELLERSGIHSIEQLKDSDPDKLLGLVQKKQDSLRVKIQGNVPGHKTVAHWIDEARDHRFSAEGLA